MSIKYTKGNYKYQLVEEFVYQTNIKPKKTIRTYFITLQTDGLLRVRKGYVWDGPSGLTIDTKSSMQGSLAHDALYELMRKNLLLRRYRKAVDKLLRQICVEDKMWEFRAQGWYKAVRIGAGPAADPRRRKKIYTAP